MRPVGGGLCFHSKTMIYDILSVVALINIESLLMRLWEIIQTYFRCPSSTKAMIWPIYQTAASLLTVELTVLSDISNAHLKRPALI